MSNQTAANFEKAMRDFIDYANTVVKGKEGKKPRFPEFRLTPEIKQKAQRANQRFADGDIVEAFELLQNLKRHFDSQQAAYARKTLLVDLHKELEYVAKNYDQDLIDRAAKVVTTYEELVTGGFFDLEKASTAYYLAIDELTEIHKLVEIRAEERKNNEAKKQAQAAKERQEKQKEEAERARKLAEDRRREAAAKLDAQLADL